MGLSGTRKLIFLRLDSAIHVLHAVKMKNFKSFIGQYQKKIADLDVNSESSTWPVPLIPMTINTPPRRMIYSVRSAPPKELVPFLRKVVRHVGFIRPDAQEQVFAYLCGREELQINLSPLSKLELRLMGFAQTQAPIFQGLLDILTRRALALPVPAGVFSAMSIQAIFHWQRAERLKVLIDSGASASLMLSGCKTNCNCDWCASRMRSPQAASLDLVDEMITGCTCYPCCTSQFVSC